MKTYLRMLKMVKPYTTQLVMALVFMVIFSVMSIFSITMISPFLQALLLEDDPDALTSAADPATESPLIIQDEAGVPHDSLPERSVELAERDPKAVAAARDAATRARYEELKDKFTGIDSVKLEFRRWADETLLKGTKKEALLRICLVFFGLALLKNIFCYLQEVLMVFVGQAVIRDLRNELYLKLTAMPLSFYHQHKAGELISRATNDVLIAQPVSYTHLTLPTMQ